MSKDTNHFIREKFAEYLNQQLVLKIQGVAMDLEQLRWLVGESRELDLAMRHVRAQLSLAAVSLSEAFALIKDGNL